MVYGIESSIHLVSKPRLVSAFLEGQTPIHGSAKRGYRANMVIRWGEWWEAKDRAMGSAENEIACFTSIFEKPTTRNRSISRHGRPSGLPSTAPPPYTSRGPTWNRVEISMVNSSSTMQRL